jgi:hypothetical protein
MTVGSTEVLRPGVQLLLVTASFNRAVVVVDGNELAASGRAGWLAVRRAAGRSAHTRT